MGGAEVDKEDNTKLHSEGGGDISIDKIENRVANSVFRTVNADSSQLQYLISTVF